MARDDLEDLKRDAIRHIVFHTTPRSLLESAGPWVLDHGEGADLYDADGCRYLDALAGGVFAVLAGYGREEIARAMYDQAVRLAYTSPYGTTSEVTVNLARRLADLAPGDISASFFCSSGSEAVEAAFKLARQYHQAMGDGRRYKVVSRAGSTPSAGRPTICPTTTPPEPPRHNVSRAPHPRGHGETAARPR